VHKHIITLFVLFCVVGKIDFVGNIGSGFDNGMNKKCVQLCVQ